MIDTTLMLLVRLGFTIGHVEEFGPTNERIAARPELAEELEPPMRRRCSTDGFPRLKTTGSAILKFVT